MKKRTKAEKFGDYADAVKCIREGKPMKRSIAKDGSIPTHPVVPVPPFNEATVLKYCMEWLKKHRILCNRNNTGTLPDASGFHRYGIAGGGDIIGLFHDGKHFEIECKAGKGGRLKKNQQKRMKDIRENQGLYFVVHGVAELEHYMGGIVE